MSPATTRGSTLATKTYKTGEACKELDVQPYVLRYWETEFPMLRGKKSGAQRTYTEDELVKLRRIKELLYDEGYTIAGAKKRIEAEAEVGGSDAPAGKAKKKAKKKKATKKAKKKKAGKAAASGAGASLDSEEGQSIESVLPELRRLHREARKILELVRET